MPKEIPEDVIRQALAAGLSLALETLPQDVIAAAAQAAAEQKALTLAATSWAEPWPPMRVMVQQEVAGE